MTTISRRDYFAAHAPECPWYFKATDIPDRPDEEYIGFTGDSTRDSILFAKTRPTLATMEWDRQYQEIRFAAWRKYWAELMIETMGEE